VEQQANRRMNFKKPIEMPSTCEQKSLYVKAYSIAAEDFARSVADLNAKTATSLKPEYDRLRNATQEFHTKMEQAKLELERHIASHGC
jgi:hypothetical protein